MPNKAKPSGHRQASLDREVYYVDGKREENVSYTTPLDAFGTKLGTNARKRGLSEAEEELYRSSLGSLCAQIMRSSQQSLNKNQQVIKDSTDSSNQVNTQRAPSRSRKDSTPDIEKVRISIIGQPLLQRAILYWDITSDTLLFFVQPDIIYDFVSNGYETTWNYADVL